MLNIYIDADGCPVKDEVLRVATRHKLITTFVANNGMTLPKHESIRLVVVGEGADAADDWIAEHVEAGDIAVTTDIPLAARCIKKGARVLRPQGGELDEATIGSAKASRDLKAELRGAGVDTGGPPPFSKKDRSKFLQDLDKLVQQIKRAPK